MAAKWILKGKLILTVKENLLEAETVTIFTAEEVIKFKADAFSTFKDGKPKYQQAAAYILILP